MPIARVLHQQCLGIDRDADQARIVGYHHGHGAHPSWLWDDDGRQWDQQGGVYGESFSLGIEPGEHDQRLVNDMFGINEHCNEICPFYGFKDGEVVEAPNCKV